MVSAPSAVSRCFDQAFAGFDAASDVARRNTSIFRPRRALPERPPEQRIDSIPPKPPNIFRRATS